MKKRLLVIIIAVAILAVGVVAFLIGNTTGHNKETTTDTTAEMGKVTNPAEEKLAGHFKLSDYEDMIGKTSREESFDPISDIDTLLEKTEKLWVEVYGKDVQDQKPYLVYFDQETGAWLVQGTFHNPDGNKKGGVANILVDHETGDVLAVWHTK